MTKEQLLQMLKANLRIRVDVRAGGIPYEDGDEVRVKVALHFGDDDELICEDECSSTLPGK